MRCGLSAGLAWGSGVVQGGSRKAGGARRKILNRPLQNAELFYSGRYLAALAGAEVEIKISYRCRLLAASFPHPSPSSRALSLNQVGASFYRAGKLRHLKTELASHSVTQKQWPSSPSALESLLEKHGFSGGRTQGALLASRFSRSLRTRKKREWTHSARRTEFRVADLSF